MTSPAKALNDKQRHYDLLHHRKRIEWLGPFVENRTAKGGVLPKWEAKILLNQSRRYVADPTMSCGAVDLNDTAYLAELDLWAAKAPPS